MRITAIRGVWAPILLCPACGLRCRPSALDGQGRCSRCEHPRPLHPGASSRPRRWSAGQTAGRR